MKFDLHCHSNASDGALAPEAVLGLAIEADLALFALTDHDTLAGYQAIRRCERPDSMRLISGVEFSTQWRTIGVHIVGLAMDSDDTRLTRMLAHLQETRAQRGELIAEKIAAAVPALSRDALYSAALAYSDGSAQKLARPHFARALVDFNVVKNQQQAFKRLLGPGKTGDVRHSWPDMADIVRLIRELGGVPVLAHPAKYKITLRKLRLLAEDFVSAGGLAIEVLTTGQTPQETRQLTELCDSLKLYASGGSDFHAPDTAWCKLGGIPPLPSVCTPIWELL